MPRSRTLAVVGLALLLVLAGCTGSMSGGSDAGEPLGAEGGADRAGGGDAGGGAGGSADGDQEQARNAQSDAVALRQRTVIRTGRLSLAVDDYETARSSVTAMARDRGGYVSDSRQETHRRNNESWTTGRVVIRVPSDQFDDAFSEAKEYGRVESAETNSEDVTDQLVDIEARLANLRAERDRLRTLYQEANETEDVLRVSRELSDVQEEIERLEARQRQLEGQVEYATITVDINEEPPGGPPGPDEWWETGVLAAFLSSVSGVVTVVRALIVGAAYAAPYVLVFGTPVVGGAYLLWRRLR